MFAVCASSRQGTAGVSHTWSEGRASYCLYCADSCSHHILEQHQYAMSKLTHSGSRSTYGRIQRPTRPMPSNSLWRYPWSIRKSLLIVMSRPWLNRLARSIRAFPNRW